MRIARVLRTLIAMSPSRRRQWFTLKRDRLVTALLHARRLRRVGAATIVQKPLFWTPEFIELGERVLIWSGCRIEAIDRYGDRHFQPSIRFGDDVSLQQFCHIVIASKLEIGRDTTISSNVFITDSDHEHEAIGVNVLQQPLTIRRTTIGQNCFIGVGARILAGTHLGNHCVVAANAVVRGTFPDYCVIAGIPGKIVKRRDPDAGEWRRTDAEGQFL